MKSLILVVLGVVVGFVAAARVVTTPRGERFVADLDARTKAFTAAVADGYRSREAELRRRRGADA